MPKCFARLGCGLASLKRHGEANSSPGTAAVGGDFAQGDRTQSTGDSTHIGPKPKILAVVKSNAYGLGAVPIAKTLQKAGVEWFGVTCANEGIELRESGIRKPHSGSHGILAGRGKAPHQE